MNVVLIAAVAENMVIGKDGDIPWHYPEDFKHFKETTTGHPVIMGRTTYEGIVAGLGGPLPDRTNIVLSFEELDGLSDDVVNVHSIEEALDAAEATGADTVYVAGGGSVYEQFLDQGRADRLLITWIPEEPDGDTYFPEWDDVQWEQIDEKTIGDNGLRVVTYEHRD